MDFICPSDSPSSMRCSQQCMGIQTFQGILVLIEGLIISHLISTTCKVTQNKTTFLSKMTANYSLIYSNPIYLNRPKHAKKAKGLWLVYHSKNVITCCIIARAVGMTCGVSCMNAMKERTTWHSWRSSVSCASLLSNEQIYSGQREHHKTNQN